MKDLHGTATATVSAPLEECFALLDDIDGYPRWHPDVVREAHVLERDGDGRPTQASATLHASVGPLAKNFPLLLAVTSERPTMIRLARIPHDPRDDEEFEVTWRLSEAGRTTITLELNAKLAVPRFLPVAGIANSVAQGLVAAAARALTSRSP